MEEDREGFHRNVGFLETVPDAEEWATVEADLHERERIALVGREVYSLIQREPGELDGFAFHRVAKTLRAPVTVRNWNTTRRLAQSA